MQVRLTKEFRFEMAHALYGYDGACRNIHGHSYVLRVTVLGTPLNDGGQAKNGMVMDFSELKRIVHEKVLAEVDHALVLNGNSPHRELGSLDAHFEKVIYMPYQPTCENLLLDFRNRIGSALPAQVKLQSMALQETETAWAEWFEEDNR
jgi:6-pyruvoyl tetrahydropterin synthase/QueD family protein